MRIAVLSLCILWSHPICPFQPQLSPGLSPYGNVREVDGLRRWRARRHVVLEDATSEKGDRRRRHTQQHYEICIGGHLGDTFRSAFEDLQAGVRGGDTVLSGEFADQAALYGVLAQLEALGLELIEVRRGRSV